MTTLRSRLSLAATAALVALSTAAPTSAAFAQSGEQVHCYGINTCKGQSDCKTAKNDCKGQNSCKGHGFKAMTAEQCTAAGGSLTEPK